MKWKITDLWSTGYYKPEEKNTENFSGSGRQEGDYYIIEAYRDLKPGGENTAEIVLDTNYPLIWAENDYTSQLKYHTAYGEIEVLIPSDGTDMILKSQSSNREGWWNSLSVH